ncbi:MAG: winged helix-turn-helix transcriptional regulator [Desulfosarcina sp.]|nr:winged helix-turn-helix transcriptional regulator [Desulfobacterales bacterium]
MSSINTSPAAALNSSRLPPETLARLCKALGHPARMAIIGFLKDNDLGLCGRIVDHLPLAQSTVSQHLRYLKECGLITGEVGGASRGYCLNRPLMAQLQRSLSELLTC